VVIEASLTIVAAAAGRGTAVVHSGFVASSIDSVDQSGVSLIKDGQTKTSWIKEME
jgi:hypothetical protein